MKMNNTGFMAVVTVLLIGTILSVTTIFSLFASEKILANETNKILKVQSMQTAQSCLEIVSLVYQELGNFETNSLRIGDTDCNIEVLEESGGLSSLKVHTNIQEINTFLLAKIKISTGKIFSVKEVAL